MMFMEKVHTKMKLDEIRNEKTGSSKAINPELVALWQPLIQNFCFQYLQRYNVFVF